MSLEDLDFAAIRARIKRDEAENENLDFQSAATYELARVIALTTAEQVRESMLARGAVPDPPIEREVDPRLLPGLTLIDPATGEQGATVVVSITGTRLDIARPHVAGPGVTFEIMGVTATQIDLIVEIAANAPLGAHVVTLRSLGGSTVGTFTVVAPAP